MLTKPELIYHRFMLAIHYKDDINEHERALIFNCGHILTIIKMKSVAFAIAISKSETINHYQSLTVLIVKTTLLKVSKFCTWTGQKSASEKNSTSLLATLADFCISAQQHLNFQSREKPT